MRKFANSLRFYEVSIFVFAQIYDTVFLKTKFIDIDRSLEGLCDSRLSDFM